MKPVTPAARYATLDGLRGVAALMVVLYHVGFIRDFPTIAPNGFLAVDFFLMLSGFILASRYQHEIEAGLPVLHFFKLRIARLYPLGLVGVLLGCFKLALAAIMGQVPEGKSSIIAACLLNLFILPYISMTKFREDLFPTNIAMWSLYAELAINAVWATLAAFRVSASVYMALALLSGALLLFWASTAGISALGWTSIYLLGGCARVMFAFLLGSLIYRLPRPRRRIGFFCHPLTLSVALLAVLGAPDLGHWYEILAVYLLLPVILYLGISAGKELTAPLREILGDLSYPLYAIHHPLLLLLFGLRQKYAPQDSVFLFFAAGMALAIGGSYLLVRFYDAPARRLLTHFMLAKTGRNIAIKNAPANVSLAGANEVITEPAGHS
jgi:peptidoglycan/LPS O-acetylase OafA/YrhL